MNYRIDKKNGYFFIEKQLFNFNGKYIKINSKRYDSIEKIERGIKELKINNGWDLIFSKHISFTDILDITEGLNIPLNKIKIEGIEQKVLYQK